MTDFYHTFAKILMDEADINDIRAYVSPEDDLYGMNIYRRNFMFGAINALSNLFPNTRYILGEECFEAFAKLFVLEYPPLESNLLMYSEEFINFLKTQDTLKGIAYLSEFMRLEYLKHLAYHGQQEEDIDHKNLSPKSMISLKSNCQIMHSSYNIKDIYDFCIQENNQENQSQEQQLQLVAGDHYILLRRTQGFIVKIEYLSKNHFMILQTLQNNSLTIDQLFAKLNFDVEYMTNIFADILQLNILRLQNHD